MLQNKYYAYIDELRQQLNAFDFVRIPSQLDKQIETGFDENL